MTFFDNGNLGVIAQLGERLTGSQEVVGSIPTSSTNYIKGLSLNGLTLFLSWVMYGLCGEKKSRYGGEPYRPMIANNRGDFIYKISLLIIPETDA